MVSQEGNPSEHHLYLYLHVRYMYHVEVSCQLILMCCNDIHDPN